VKYLPIDNFSGARRSVETSAEACRARCEHDPGCGFFSFWEKEIPDDVGCTLFGETALFGKANETFAFITGPSACPEETEQPKGCQGGNGCCSLELPCGLGEGDCDSNEDCEGSLKCGIDNCQGPFFTDGQDCCSDKCYGGSSCCSEEYPCGLGEGDCDSNSECRGDLRCGTNNCANGTTFADGDDCCTEKCDGGDSCCTEEYPCGEDEGDCDSDSDCTGELVCGSNNCPKGTTFEDGDDCCVSLGGPGCVNTTLCYDEELDPKGEKFDGCATTTKSGRTCQAWASTTPHSHRFKKLRTESNNCRNPDGEPGPWCYTTDPDKRWELCPDLTCAKGDQE